MSGEKEPLDFHQQNRALAKIEPQVRSLSLIEACKAASPQETVFRFAQVDWNAYIDQFGLGKKDSVWRDSQGRLLEELFTITRYYEMYDKIVHEYVAREQKAFKGCGCYGCLREHRLIADWYITPNPDLE